MDLSCLKLLPIPLREKEIIEDAAAVKVRIREAFLTLKYMSL